MGDSHKEPLYKTMRKHRDNIEGPCLDALEIFCMDQVTNAIDMFCALMDFEVSKHPVNIIEGATIVDLRIKFAKKVGRKLKDPAKAYVFQKLIDEIIKEATAAKIKHDARKSSSNDAAIAAAEDE